MKSPVNISQLVYELKDHPDSMFVEYLIDGFQNGFDTGLSQLPEQSYECNNLLSAKRYPNSTTELLETELSRGYIIGPYDSAPFPQYRISPLGIAVGKYSGKKRLIVDLSAPHENELHPSLNELINKEDFSLSYVTIDSAISVIKKIGMGAWMCKIDIKDAFKLIPIKQSLWPYHGVKWNNQYYFYTRLVFGNRSSPKIFDALSVAICWILEHNYNIKNILHLLDDFLTIDPPDSMPDRTMAILTMLFNKLGIPLSTNKSAGPTNVLEYLGIILDSLKMEARLPLEKIHRIADIIGSFQNKKSCTKQELLSLLGHLNFASRVIYPGRAFVSYLIRLSTTVKDLHHHVKLSNECRLDLKMWSLFLKQWNGISFFLDEETTQSDNLKFYTDATPTGYGGYYNGMWFYGEFDIDLVPSSCKASMALFELYPIVMAAVLWGKHWCKKRIVVNCDNAATVEIINKGRSKIPFIMKFVRKLVWHQAQYNFVMQANFIEGRKNVIADSLSRFQIDRFRRLAPSAEPQPTNCLPASELMLF